MMVHDEISGSLFYDESLGSFLLLMVGLFLVAVAVVFVCHLFKAWKRARLQSSGHDYYAPRKGRQR